MLNKLTAITTFKKMFFEKKCITFFLQNFTIQIYYTNIKKKINIKVYRKLQILLYKCKE